MTKLKFCCIVNLEHVFHKTIQEDDSISPSRNIFAVDISGVSGSRSTDPKDIEKEVKAVFEASLGKEEAELVTRGITQVAVETRSPSSQSTTGSQSTTPPTNQPTTQTTTPSTTYTTQRRTPTQSNITPINADDDFLRGFYKDYENERPISQVTRPSTWDDNQKSLSHKGITEITDPFLDGFNKGCEDKQKQSELSSKKGSPVSNFSGYTGAWEEVQPDTTGSGFQIRAWAEDPQPKTEEELQTAYEKAKSRFDAVSQELERYMRDNRDWNTPWYDALSREYSRAWEQYNTLKKQYEEQFPDNRLWGVISGSGMDYAGQMLSSAGAMIEGLTEYFPAYGPYQNEIVGFNPSAYIPERDTTLITEYISDPLREKGADLSQKGQAKVQEQKKGLGKFGQFAVDLGSAATQMVLDIGLGVVTGGSMAIPAAIRTFGSSATEAAAEGADLNQQMLYATTSAAATYGIEQLCNVAYAGIKGVVPGVADKTVTEIVENLAKKFVGNPKGAEAVKNIGMLIASGASEGVEETLESLLQPFLQQMSYDKSAENVFQNPKLLADAAYEGLIGTVLGLFGRGTSNAVDLVHNMIYDGIMPGGKLMADAGVGESEVLGAMAIHQMGKMDDTTAMNHSEQTSGFIDTEFENILELAANGDKITLSEEMESFIADKSFREIELLSGKLTNRAVRKWYLSHDAAIKTEIDLTGSLEQQAQQAFDLRNLYRTQARDLMEDQTARTELDKTDPNKTFEELIADKMRRKGLTREEALEDIISTAGKTRKTINKALGLE